MYAGLELDPPFFELGPKAYVFGEELLELARCADALSAQYSVPIIITPQYVDIPRLARETTHLLIFAQHMDPLKIGRGVGSVLPEAIKEAGAVGTLLNHAEKPLPHSILRETIRRADEVGLASMVCAADLAEVQAVCGMNPNIIIAESPDQIGTGSPATQMEQDIKSINKLVWSLKPEIHVLHAAGISNGEDVYEVIAAGAQATGSTSGVLLAPRPSEMLEEMIRNVRDAWDKTHPGV